MNTANEVYTGKTVKTFWELWNYDVWGNKEDGFYANDRFCFNRKYEINLKVIKCNPDTPNEFLTAYPTDYQIKKAFGVSCKLTLDGDDRIIYVTRESDGYLIGEMILTSHSGLSPIKE